MSSKYLFTLFLLYSFVFAGGNVTFSEYNAQPGANKVYISWATQNEQEVKYFSIQRSNDDSKYTELTQINPHGPGYHYEYEDQNVLFKGNGALFYKITAISSDGTQIGQTSIMMVHPNISGIFRTWGAIKAVFR